MSAAPKPKTPQPCPVCGYRGHDGRQAGENDIWQCSHVECPNRRQVTAAPSDRPPQP